MTDRPELTEEMKQDGWLPFETAPDGEAVELLTVTVSGGLNIEIGIWDTMDGGFFTHGELWPVQLYPIAWSPIQPVDWRLARRVAGALAALLSILLVVVYIK